VAEFTLFDSLRRLRRCDEPVICVHTVTGALVPLTYIFHPEELQFYLDLGRILRKGDFDTFFSAYRAEALFFRNLDDFTNYGQIFWNCTTVSLVARLSATLSFWMPGDMMHIAFVRCALY